MATTGGTVKKTEIADFSNVRASGLIAIKLKGSEQLSWVEPTTGNDDLILVTEKGQSVLFHEKDVRPMGRASQGVRGIRLKDKDTVVQLLKIPDDQDGAIFVLGSHGYGKKTNKKEFSAQKRGGSGVRISKVTTKTGNLVGAAFISKGDMESDIMVTSSQGQIIRLPVKSIPSIGRATQGVIIMRLDKGDSVSSFAVYLHEESEVTTKQQEPALVK